MFHGHGWRQEDQRKEDAEERKVSFWEASASNGQAKGKEIRIKGVQKGIGNGS